jgi:para-aminobenzoate synthetase/4-amino-4-deoxychorismate lyase
VRAIPHLRFDFADPAGRRAPLIFEHPVEIVVAADVRDVRRAMQDVEAGLRRGLYAAGYVSYEAAPAFDAALTTREPSGPPLVWFGLFERPVSDASSSTTHDDIPLDERPGPAWTPDITRDDHRAGVAAVRDAILSGDSYQANYTFRLRAPIDPRTTPALYRRLSADQRAPYSAWLDLGAWQMLSLSPELFFRIDGGRLVTRPMKGTAPRGLWREDDEAQAAWLAASEKNRAENVMIVDLARNDVGRVAEIGSVRASSLFDVERYPSVLQMVSTVEGRLRAGTTLTDVFTALFPAGSITGAPKTSSMRLIASIERAPRGVYCGAIGYASPAGDAVFNVAIRTATIDVERGVATYGVGGGITWDSRADDEYAEAISKAACLTPAPAFDLIETMRLEGGRYVREARHLRRLRESATFFDRSFDDDVVVRALREHARSHAGTSRRVRLLLDATGHPHIESRPLEVPVREPAPVALAAAPVSRDDWRLYHKTTQRDVYDRHRRARPDVFDVLLWNDERVLTEFTIGNLVAEIDGACWTPDRRAGLLAGVFRGELLDAGEIRERVITLDDLSRATRLWLINSLREWVDVRLQPSAPDSNHVVRRT